MNETPKEPGQPVAIMIRLAPALASKLRDLAGEQRRSLNNLVAAVLTEYLEERATSSNLAFVHSRLKTLRAALGAGDESSTLLRGILECLSALSNEPDWIYLGKGAGKTVSFIMSKTEIFERLDGTRGALTRTPERTDRDKERVLRTDPPLTKSKRPVQRKPKSKRRRIRQHAMKNA